MYIMETGDEILMAKKISLMHIIHVCSMAKQNQQLFERLAEYH